jgi:hypothetical protein
MALSADDRLAIMELLARFNWSLDLGRHVHR